jgi:hypothetical protein
MYFIFFLTKAKQIQFTHFPSAEVKERVELYLFFLSGKSWPVIEQTLPLPYTLPSRYILILSSHLHPGNTSIHFPSGTSRICCRSCNFIASWLLWLSFRNIVMCGKKWKAWCYSTCKLSSVLLAFVLFNGITILRTRSSVIPLFYILTSVLETVSQSCNITCKIIGEKI